MQFALRKLMFVLIAVIFVVVASGCTNWEKEYGMLNVEHENVKGLLEREQVERIQLEEQVVADQKTIAELRKQIAEKKRSVGDITGFGDKYAVAFDGVAGTVTVTLPKKVLFSSGKADLKKSSFSDLDHIISVLRQSYINSGIDVAGHTDSDPIKRSKWKDNWQLSTERSLSVLRYLIKQGIAGDHVRAVGYGSSKPIASNKTAAGKAKNRRVDIVVHVQQN